MPIKEIMAIASVIVTGWFMTGGPKAVQRNLRTVQIRILKEVTRTDTWGSPSIFSHKRRPSYLR